MLHQEARIETEIDDVKEISVIGPMGKRITRQDLPAPGTKRWVVRRKAEVVAGVSGGLISLNEACQRYNLSEDEFKTWLLLFQSHGLSGLRATGCKKSRRPTLLLDQG